MGTFSRSIEKGVDTNYIVRCRCELLKLPSVIVTWYGTRSWAVRLRREIWIGDGVTPLIIVVWKPSLSLPLTLPYPAPLCMKPWLCMSAQGSDSV